MPEIVQQGGGMPKSVLACTAFFSLRASCMKIFCYRAWGSAMDRAQRILLYMHRAQACPFFTCVNYVHRAWRFFVNVHRARTPHAGLLHRFLENAFFVFDHRQSQKTSL